MLRPPRAARSLSTGPFCTSFWFLCGVQSAVTLAVIWRPSPPVGDVREQGVNHRCYRDHYLCFNGAASTLRSLQAAILMG